MCTFGINIIRTIQSKLTYFIKKIQIYTVTVNFVVKYLHSCIEAFFFWLNLLSTILYSKEYNKIVCTYAMVLCIFMKSLLKSVFHPSSVYDFDEVERYGLFKRMHKIKYRYRKIGWKYTPFKIPNGRNIFQNNNPTTFQVPHCTQQWNKRFSKTIVWFDNRKHTSKYIWYLNTWRNVSYEHQILDSKQNLAGKLRLLWH